MKSLQQPGENPLGLSDSNLPIAANSMAGLYRRRLRDPQESVIEEADHAYPGKHPIVVPEARRPE